MKKRHIVILLAQTLLIFMFLVYALVQRTQAIKQRELTIEAQSKAEENERRALEQEAIVSEAMRSAAAAQAEATKVLEECLRNTRK